MNKKFKITFVIIVVLIMVFGCFCMTLSPKWNGDIIDYKDQYEETAIAFKEGHTWLNHEVDPKLLELENPYDTQARYAAGIELEWDHAYYNGHYYMYFGVVPVIILFLPFLLITGNSLLVTHATMIFYCFGIIGLALFFSFIKNRIFKSMPNGVFLLLYSSSCFLSYWIVACFPALYCTAVSSGICLEIWALYFIFKSIYDDNISYKLSSLYLVLGALFGAAVFGCRPPLGIASVLLMIPLFIKLIKQYKDNNHSILSLILKTILPYVIIASLLMWYNYIRFGNVFEFGLSYMLTLSDLSMHKSFFNDIPFKYIIQQFVNTLFLFPGLSVEFPYISYSGVLFEFTILLYIWKIFSKDIQKVLKGKDLLFFSIMIIVTFLITVFVQISSTPDLIERYKSDFCYLLSILLFIVIGAHYEQLDKKYYKSTNIVISGLCVYTMISSCLLFMIPDDHNFTEYFPDIFVRIQNMFP